MELPSSIASRLYDIAKPATQPDPRPSAGGQSGEFNAAASDFVRALRDAETTVQAGLAGGAEPQAVVEALAATELAVQTAVAVRDRVVEAYQEILRMPV